MSPHFPAETRLVRNLVRLHGRDPRGFQAAVLPGGRLQMLAPCGAAFYPLDGWTSRFVRHLVQGFFDPRHPATLSGAAAAISGAGGTG